MTQEIHATSIVASNVDLGEYVQVGPYAVIGDESDAATTIGPNVVIGAHSYVAPGLRVGRSAQILPGTVVATDVPPFALVSGNPAKIRGYSSSLDESPVAPVRVSHVEPEAQLAELSGTRLVRVRSAVDLRGSLMAGEFADLPFVPQRFFVVHGVSSGHVRGEHAHRRCEQLLFALSGTVRCMVDDGIRRQEIVLNAPEVGLYLPPMVWGTQFGHSSDALLLVLASRPYEPDDYIREYEEFVSEAQRSFAGDIGAATC